MNRRYPFEKQVNKHCIRLLDNKETHQIITFEHFIFVSNFTVFRLISNYNLVGFGPSWSSSNRNSTNWKSKWKSRWRNNVWKYLNAQQNIQSSLALQNLTNFQAQNGSNNLEKVGRFILRAGRFICRWKNIIKLRANRIHLIDS